MAIRKTLFVLKRSTYLQINRIPVRDLKFPVEGQRAHRVDPDKVATFLTPPANEQGHPSTMPRWYGCRARVFCRLTELPMRGREEPA